MSWPTTAPRAAPHVVLVSRSPHHRILVFIGGKARRIKQSFANCLDPSEDIEI